MTAVQLERVSFQYPTADHPALRAVSLDLESARVTWFLGRLGAGCSTLLQVIGGLAPRHTGGRLEGRVSTLGVDTVDPRAPALLAGRIGYVTASPLLQLSGVAATVWEEVAFAPANLGWPIETIRDSVGRALDRLGVAHLSARDPATLSGGELQRVVFAAMLALEPELWLLDEPASALDLESRDRVYALLCEEAARGATVLIASEDADALVAVADRLVVLDQGAVVLDGPPHDLLAGEEIWRVGPGSTSVAELARGAAERVPSPRTAAPWPVTVEEAVRRWGEALPPTDP
ncbi:MAG: energy-coupling factor ABC transporter ATP-binding protein [Gemmatimonadota bacterium]